MTYSELCAKPWQLSVSADMLIRCFCVLSFLEVEEGLGGPTRCLVLVPVWVWDWWHAWCWPLDVSCGLEVLGIRGWSVSILGLVSKCLSPIVPLVPAVSIVPVLWVVSVVISVICMAVAVSIVPIIIIIAVSIVSVIAICSCLCY